MEDTHVWTLDVAIGCATELGAQIDNRQGRPQWSPDGKSLYFTVQSRGSVGLYRLPATGGAAERVGPALDTRGSVGAFAVAKDGRVVAAMTTPSAPAELFVPASRQRQLRAVDVAEQGPAAERRRWRRSRPLRSAASMAARSRRS